MIRSDTIAAVSTPSAPGGIAMVRVTGPDALKIASAVFRSAQGKLEETGSHRALYGKVYDGALLLDEAVALVFRAPHGFTGEDTVELTVHGGVYLAARVLHALLKAGARPAEPGEFTRRAFENGKIDLAEAESVMQLISAQGEQGLRAAAAVLDGALSRRVRAEADRIKSLSAAVAAYIDFPEDDLPELHPQRIAEGVREVLESLRDLLKEHSAGRLLTEGVHTAIVGRPNVGKSALMNRLIGEERSIVTEHAGTTRDVIRERVELGGLPLILADTAGIRETEDVIEAMGVDRSKKELEHAGLLLAIFDASRPLTDEDRDLLEVCAGRPCVAVLNKSDLPQTADASEIESRFPTVRVSALTGEGLDRLEATVKNVLEVGNVDPSAGILANERQFACVRRAAECAEEALRTLESGMTPDVAGILLDDALAALLELTGERVTDAVADEIFAKFCVGK